MTYSVKNVKTFNTPDGGGYNASFYCGKTKVANIHDGGFGGCLEYDWVDTTIGRTGKINPDQHFEKDFYAFLKTHKIPDFEWDSEKRKFVDIPNQFRTPTDDLFVGNLVRDFDDMKLLKRELKKEVLVVKHDKGTVHGTGDKPTPENVAQYVEVALKEGMNMSILNSLPLEEAWEIWRNR